VFYVLIYPNKARCTLDKRKRSWKKSVLGAKSPLFGRRTAQFKLGGFDYYDAAQMLGSASNEDKIKYYACIGGTPHYLAQVDRLLFEENVIDLYFTPQGYLYSEPAMLLQQELREPAMYTRRSLASLRSRRFAASIYCNKIENPRCRF